MILIFFLLFIICGIALILGLIKPSLVLRWLTGEEQNRKNVLKYFGVGLLASIIMMVVITPSSDKETTDLVAEDKENSEEELSDELVEGYTLKYGELLDVIENDYDGESKIVIKAKIEPMLTNRQTIQQNGFNIEDLVLNQGVDKFDVIDYWAVAEMSDGSERKVISFSVNKYLIDGLKNETIFGSEVIENVNDLWVIPSLLE